MEPPELEQQLFNAEEEIELLQQTFTEIGSQLDLESIYHIVAHRAKTLVQAKTLLIPILDQYANTYTYCGGAGDDADTIIGETMPIDYGVCGWVWAHKKAWWSETINELSEEEKARWNKESNTIILVPLQGPKHFLGGIAGINKIGGGDFTRRDLNLLSLFASIVAIAIENAFTVQEIETANKVNAEYQMRMGRLNKRLVANNQRLEHLSLYDPLTALPNRSLFKGRLSQQLKYADHQDNDLSILLIDLNDFKQVNDTLGHDQGDALLQKVTKRLSAFIDQDKTFSRLGGDEFTLILADSDSADASRYAQSLLNLLDTPFALKQANSDDATPITIHASIGIASYPEHGEDTNTLLSHVDHAMYHAKSSKSGYSIYNPDEDQSSLFKVTLVADLHQALDQNEFTLYYQPKLDIETGTLIGVEALARWPRDGHGMTPPDQFIPCLEQTGLINRFTDWAIREALLQIQCWNNIGFKIKIAVNISTQTLVSQDFISTIKNSLSNHPFRHQLLFEITENLFLSDYDNLADTLALIRDMDVHLSIDDFGTGYSSLSRLKKLPVSELKIDQSFIRDMTTDMDDAAIVRSTVDLAHNLGLLVVAEGIESQDIYQQLLDMGCDIAQGYFISKPLPEDEFTAFLTEHFDENLKYKNLTLLKSSLSSYRI
ncbi:MAG: bifunctional diguanylate cyclase/phosphodiesterase [Methylococcales bacterium]|nr:bifunctional diguanylate cyclase/phosphodiesterase [Methylococcales bacterium]MBT7445174.1 bifunctional diguanylate cyclase/phosphodiesterase [Methylococcales bacterium]